jgi:hypothetical protein
VSIFGANPVQPTPGLTAADRAAARDRKAGPSRGVQAKRAEDTVTVATESEGAVRGLAGNSQEEAHEDRQERQAYTPGGRGGKGQIRSLDVQG